MRMNWIYWAHVRFDPPHDNMIKIGATSGSPFSRLQRSCASFYDHKTAGLRCVPAERAFAIETNLRRFLWRQFGLLNVWPRSRDWFHLGDQPYELVSREIKTFIERAA